MSVWMIEIASCILIGPIIFYFSKIRAKINGLPMTLYQCVEATTLIALQLSEFKIIFNINLWNFEKEFL